MGLSCTQGYEEIPEALERRGRHFNIVVGPGAAIHLFDISQSLMKLVVKIVYTTCTLQRGGSMLSDIVQREKSLVEADIRASSKFPTHTRVLVLAAERCDRRIRCTHLISSNFWTITTMINLKRNR